MRTAETVLGIIRKRGSNGLPLEDAYRQLFNPDLYLAAYGKIAANQGAMTRGVTTETVDGMSLKRIQDIIDAIRTERYRWTPVRRVNIPKSNGKTRPLGVPTWSDKLLQECIRLILEAYYEPQFSQTSHGFRPERGCHTALKTISQQWTGTTWFIEGDISQCFDSLDHMVLLSILREKIHDNRFLRLIENMLKAGYLEDWKYHATYSGTPQGGIVSPILSNIYLDRLDKFIEQRLLPAFNHGTRRKMYPLYNRMNVRAWEMERTGKRAEARILRKHLMTLPTVDPNDPGFRRLRYIRYADDFILGFVGPRHEAEEIKLRVGTFLRDSLKLELSDSKTLITHARTEAARFLGYDIRVHQDNTYRRKAHRGRTINGNVALQVPVEVIRKHCRKHTRGGKPMHRAELLERSVFDILAQYQMEYRGLAEYYALAGNRSVRFPRLRWVMEVGLGKTLASKLKISVSQVWNRYGTTFQTPNGPRRGLEVRIDRGDKPPLVTRWGGITLAYSRDRTPVLNDQPAPLRIGHTDLIQRLLADACEVCGSTDQVQVHHVRHLKDLQRPGRAERPRWLKVMASRRRKTLVVCLGCHTDIHAGRPVQTA
jgi:group II intron reverse transcriptase/maturase